MSGAINPAPLAGAELELAKLRAGLTAGLTVEQSARLCGVDEAAITADATAFAAELSAVSPVPQAPRVGGRGSDVGSSAGTVSAGTARYRARHGIDDEGNRPPVPQRTTTGRVTNPYAERGYTMEAGR
ncbi:hypothetical protein [Streptomyces sp. NBC_01429]|uniref:hypothetical protein n=1 Tax=Streptomyces sp. NBC_01429 TaxID=2903862 RepID=UPI002E2D0483|nr:hypothetical protein [Streptomyces sp. NBC_01429]